MDMLLLSEVGEQLREAINKHIINELLGYMEGHDITLAFGARAEVTATIEVRRAAAISPKQSLPFPLDDRFSARLECIKCLIGNNRQAAQTYDRWTSEEIFNAMAPRWGIKKLEHVPRVIALVGALHVSDPYRKVNLFLTGKPIWREITEKEQMLLTAAEPLVGISHLM